jgi:hypothetical protein
VAEFDSKKKIYRCTYCSKEYDNSAKADSCLEEHHLILVPISREDIKRLVQFIYLKDERILTPTLTHTLMKFNTLRGEKG